MTYVLKLALPGTDAKKASVGQLVTDSIHPNPKIYTLATTPHAGIISLTWNTTTARAYGSTLTIDTFTHNLGYIPTVFASYDWSNGTIERRGTLPFQYGALGMIVIDADTTNINLKYFSLDLPGTTAIPAFTMTVRYYVMVEPGK